MQGVDKLVKKLESTIHCNIFKMEWGTFGKGGKEPLKWMRLIDCDLEHLRNILANCPHIPDHYRMAIKSMLEC